MSAGGTRGIETLEGRRVEFARSCWLLAALRLRPHLSGVGGRAARIPHLLTSMPFFSGGGKRQRLNPESLKILNDGTSTLGRGLFSDSGGQGLSL